MRLQITIPIEELDNPENTTKSVKEILELIDFSDFSSANIEIALTREGDRSGANLLLPKLQGRMGEHYQNRKAKLREIIKENN